MIKKLKDDWTISIDLTQLPDILNSHAQKINEVIDKLNELDSRPVFDFRLLR